MKKVFIILISVLLFFSGCDTKKIDNNEEIEKKWNESSYKDYGIDSLPKPDKFKEVKISHESENNKSLYAQLECENKCDVDDIKAYVKNIYDKIVLVSNGEMYKIKMDKDFNYLFEDKINKFEDITIIEDSHSGSYEMIYKYQDSYIVIGINGNTRVLSINFSVMDNVGE